LLLQKISLGVTNSREQKTRGTENNNHRITAQVETHHMARCYSQYFSFNPDNASMILHFPSEENEAHGE
jgi:hypothetical protein